MPKIEHIEFKRRRPERFLVHLDDGSAHLFSPEVVLKYGFAIGKTFSDGEFAGICREDGIRRAKDQVLKYLGIRPHSRRELFLKALKKGFAAEFIEAALEDLAAVGLIDDHQFTRQFIQNELLLRPCGKNLLTEKLLERGVAPEIFQPLLAEFFEKQPQEEIIRKIARKFLARHPQVRAPKRTEKLVRHLQAKGFDWTLIRAVLYDEKILDEQGDE